MATRIKLKRSTTAAAVPTTSNLEDGEVALNLADRKLYARNGGNIIEVANQKPNTGEVVTTMLATDITNGQGNTFYVASVGSDNNTLANGGDNGKHPDTPFLTVAKALSVATSGDTVMVAPGDYQETFPLTVPDGVTLRGANLRSTQIRPTTGTNDLNAIILQGDSHVSDLTIKDFFYNSGNDTGYGFVCATSLNADKSPYIERVTVLTKGSVTSGSDPYGFASANAGRGAKLDGAVFNSNSIESAILFNECTFIVPNAVGLLVTNGVRVEWLNSFVYFASEGIKGVQGATGRYGTGNTRLKLGGVSGTFSTNEVAYQLEDSFQSGTYARSGTTVTVTRTAHGLTTNDYIYADHISGTANDGFYQVTVVNANSFTYADSSSGTTSGNVTYKNAVARGTVASNDGTYVFITGKGTGEFTTVTKQSKSTSRFGDTQLDTAQQKFGTASILFDGTEDQLTVPTSDDFGFGTSNFAFECFIRPNGGSGTQRIFDFRDASATDTAPTMYLSGTSPYTLNYAVGNGAAQSGGSLATGTWYHIAAARSGGTTRIFVDGTQVASFTDTNDYGSTKPLAIGANFNTTAPTEEFTGHIDEVRVSKGAGRFTGAFTPTTTEYSSDLNTVLLLHANGTDALTTFDDASGGISDVRSSGGDSATSVITADYSQFGAELRSISSANIYGTKGAVADGAGVKLLLTSHNFAYIGADADFSNDPSLAVQANEVTELNGGKVFYSATNEKGDFRVGDAFVVDQSTGNVQFQATSQAQSAANITLSDGTGTTNIYPAYIETGNLRLAGNSLTSTTGQVIVDPSGQEDFVVNAETIVKEAVYFDANKSVSFGSNVQGALKIGGFSDSLLFGSSEASNYSSRAFVVFKNGLGTLSLDGAGSGYVGGQHTVPVTSEPFQQATASAVIATSGSIKQFNITNRGNQQYTAVPDVVLSGTGSGDGTAVLGTGQIVVSVTVDSGGSGFVSPTIAFGAPGQQTFVGGSAAITLATNTITISNHPFETGNQISLDTTTLDPAAVAPGGLAAGTYYAIRVNDDEFQVASSLANANAGTEVPITSVGSGNMFFIGVTATGTVQQSAGAITGVTITNAGTGYTGVALATVTDSAGTGENLSITMGANLNRIDVSNPGTYASGSAPTVTINAATGDTTGSGATATSTLGFAVASITLDTEGLGYRALPVVTVTGGVGANSLAPTDAVVTPVLDEKTGKISSITLDTAGDGYETAPTLTFTQGAGSGGTILVDVQSLDGTITSSGSGYTAGTYANVAFTTSGNGIDATATFTIPGFVGSITNAGSGYTDTALIAVEFRNPPTTTYTVTVQSRARFGLSSVTGTFAVGNTVTGSVSGATATVTYVGADFLYANNVSGTFQDAQTDTVSNGSGASGTLDTFSATVNRYFINGTEAANLTLTDDNTYRFDTSDASNTNHPLAFGIATNLNTRQYRTPGTAGSYFEVVVGAVSATTATSTYTCTVHGSSMSESAVITYQTGTAGQSGVGMTADATISGGQVTNITLTNQGTSGNFAVGHVFNVDQDDIGGTGSGFEYTLQSQSTGISTVTNISLNGSGYQVGDILSVSDTDVGGGGGSGFQFTVSNVGFATAVAVGDKGGAYEPADTLTLGEVGPPGSVQGTGLVVGLTTIDSEKSLELNQDGLLTLGPTGGTQLVLNQDGTVQASSWSISSAGAFTGSAINVSGTFNATGASTFGNTLTVSGVLSASAGVSISGGTSSITNTTLKLLDGTAAGPSFAFDNASSTGQFLETANTIGYTVSGTQVGRLDSTGLRFTGFSADSSMSEVNPYFKVDTATEKTSFGTVTANLFIDANTTIGTDGTDVDVPLNFGTKGAGNFVFSGGTDVDFSVTDGTNETFKIDTLTGDITASGNLDAGVLRLRDNVIANNSTGAVRSFGEVLGVNVTGTGSGYTDGTYTATATTTNGSGTGLTVTVTVASGDFSAVTIVAKGQNYAVGDTITITAAGGGTGRTITVNDVDGAGVVVKPSAGKDVLINTTGALVIPAGTTNERPNVLDRLPGAIRYNTTQLQFEGFNGSDFVSLGGVRDVDQDTYILTESAPGADEDTFEFYNAGLNSLAIDKDKFLLKTTRLMEVQGVLNIDGVTLGQNTVDFKSLGASVVKVRSKKDLEVTGGIRLRAVAQQGVAATLDATSITSTAGAYTPSLSTTATPTSSNLEGSGCTVNVSVDGSGNISTIAINAGGTTYEVGEVLTVLGTELGGASPANDVTVEIASISGAAAAFTRVDLLNTDYVTQMNSKPFISYDSNGPQAGFKINRGWNAGTQSYLTVMDSTADFVELDDCRVEGGQLTSFSTTATITAFDKAQYKGAKVLVAIESDDGKVHMLEVTVVCAAAGTDAYATVTNSVTSDNDLVDATVAVVGSSVNISLAKSTAATSSTTFTGRFTTTKVKV